LRLILSRKGFDSTSGGCASPIFPDGSMIALPIPDRRSPIRYQDLAWRGRNLGDIVARLTKGKQRADYRAHLDPDLRHALLPRHPEWHPVLGQHGAAQGHLRKQGVGVGDLFVFWGLFRAVDKDLRWAGPPQHHIWGWLQVGAVASVDEAVRRDGERWRWAEQHPHLSFSRDASNTLYIAAETLDLPGAPSRRAPGAGAFDTVSDCRHLTAPGATRPSDWSLPIGFLPQGRPPLTYHSDIDRWSRTADRALLRAAGRGQEFVLDLGRYPEILIWLSQICL
jgi:hypothetical protein